MNVPVCEGGDDINSMRRATRLPHLANETKSTMRLILLRHGRAVERSDWSGPEADRPLTPGGRRRTRAVLRAILPYLPPISAIWTSPFARAHATALLAGRAWHTPVEIHPWLAAGALPASELLALLPSSDTVLVGHEPDLGTLLGVLIGSPPIPLRKAGIAVLVGKPTAGGMTVELLLTPRLMLGL
jgi:phosphohistidine phosphatase SixA